MMCQTTRVLLYALATALSLVIQANASDGGTTATNANHIFNAIHSALRQWGSVVNHNGMSVFIATVPEGLLLYHGTNTSRVVTGMEWLAFDPELSAWSVQSPQSRQRPSSLLVTERTRQHAHQSPINTEAQEGAKDGAHAKYGYLHTYRTKHDLRLLYTDGHSAGLSCVGTLDLQDMVLLHDSPPYEAETPHCLQGFPPDAPPTVADMLDIEYTRASRLCALARDTWGGRIDGFIRTNWAFEVILCSFEDHLEAVSIDPASPLVPDAQHAHEETLAWYRACSTRFDGLGGNRVIVDFESMVTLYSMEDMVFFNRRGLPRVQNITKDVRHALQKVQEMVVNTSEDTRQGRNDWQAVTDMVVSRYGHLIEYLTSSHIESLGQLVDEVDRVLRPFRDIRTRDREREVARCAEQYMPSSSWATNSSQSAHAILTVTTQICKTFSDVLSANTLQDAVRMMLELKEWLAWSSFKKCRGCDVHEVCFVPMFPVGGVEDMAQPRCTSDVINVAMDYWFQ